MTITILPPSETSHQTEHQLVLQNLNFSLELLLFNSVNIFCLVMIALMATGRYDPQWFITENLPSPISLNFLAIPFLLAVAIALIAMQPIKTIRFDQQTGKLHINRAKWLGIKHFESCYPLSGITEVQLRPDTTSKFQDRWTVHILTEPEFYFWLPASSLLSNYSRAKAEEVANTISQFLGVDLSELG